MNVGLFIGTDHYEEFRPRGRGGSDQPGLRHHRVIAYAHGLLDSLDDPREVDHLVPIRWLNYEANLEAVEPDEHGRRTRARAQARKVRADGGQSSLQEFGGGQA